MDWNGDGLDDILVGEYDGRIKYYMSVTPDSLTEMDDIKAGGLYIDAGLIGCPLVIDWNGDFLNDLVVGFASPTEGSSMLLYINSGTPTEPVLETGVDVLFGGQQLESFGCTPWAGDLDDDGLFDILYGDAQGDMYLSLNTGTAGAPVFQTPEQVMSGSEPLNISLNAAPCIVDWNDDGHTDIVAGCGENGSIWAFLSPYTTGIWGAGQENGLTVVPVSNPAQGTLALTVWTGEPAEVDLVVYSLAGRSIVRRAISASGGIETFGIGLEGISPGVYLFSATTLDSRCSGLFTVVAAAR